MTPARTLNKACFLLLASLLLLSACSTREGPHPQDMNPDSGPEGDAACSSLCGPDYACCGAEEECHFDRCTPLCEGERCGDEGACCATGDLCIAGECVPPGAPCENDADCPEDAFCEPLTLTCIPLGDPIGDCRYRPPVGEFDPAVEWSWEGGNVVTPALVVPLTDDNDDGLTNEDDVPDVVVLADIEGRGRLVALSGDDGRVLWQSAPAHNLLWLHPPAAADVDGDGDIEIAVLERGLFTVQLSLFNAQGEREWQAEEVVVPAIGAISIGDLDADGCAEIVASGHVFDCRGAHRFRVPEVVGTGGDPAILDIDFDGTAELLYSGVVYEHDGTRRWSGGAIPTGYMAVSRIIDDPLSVGAQVVAVNGERLQILDASDGASLFGPVRYESGARQNAGPPTVADFDGDGRMEIAVAGTDRYIVFDPDIEEPPHILWERPTEDGTVGSVGSTVFDFEGDGVAEVVYADECHVRILAGTDGRVLFEADNTSATILEYPVVADVDGDGNAEVVVVANDLISAESCRTRPTPYTAEAAFRGVRVFGDRRDNWVDTRRIWNQHAYCIENIEDDGAVPTLTPAYWDEHGTYRLNRLENLADITLAPDLIITDTNGNSTGCPTTTRLRATVRNQGARGVPAGVPVAFYAGTPDAPGGLLGETRTSRTLLRDSEETVEVFIHDVPYDAELELQFFAMADDDGSGGPIVGIHSECLENNNAGEPITLECDLLQ